MGQGFSPLFAALSLGAAVGILVWLFPAGAAHDWLLDHRPGLVTVGILGNLYDRLGLPGLIGPTALSRPPARRARLRRPRLHPGDDRPLALAHLQPGRQLAGLWRRTVDLARAVQQNDKR